MSALVASALEFYLGLSGAARRSARFVLATGDAEARDLLAQGCGRAIARAADQQLTAQLAECGQAMGVQNPNISDEAIEAQAVAAVREYLSARPAVPNGHDDIPRAASTRR